MTTQIRENIVQLVSSGSLNGGRVSFNKTVSTTDNTATDLFQIPLSEGEAIVGQGMIVGCQDDETDAVSAHFEFCARRAAAGNVTLVGSPAVRILESNASTDVSVNADTSAQTVDIRVTGITAENWRFEGSISYIKV